VIHPDDIYIGEPMTLNVPVLGYVSPMTRIEQPASREAEAPERTVGDWVVTIGDDHIATLTVNIAISLPADPLAIKE
jgi:hypothetical protein